MLGEWTIGEIILGAFIAVVAVGAGLVARNMRRIDGKIEAPVDCKANDANTVSSGLTTRPS